MTILALRGADGLRDLERERLRLLERSRDGLREGVRLRWVPLRRSSRGEREREGASSTGSGALSGVIERAREMLRRGGGEDMASRGMVVAVSAIVTYSVEVLRFANNHATKR